MAELLAVMIKDESYYGDGAKIKAAVQKSLDWHAEVKRTAKDEVQTKQLEG